MDSLDVVAPGEVLVELSKRSGDALHAWATDHSGAFLPPPTSITASMGAIQPVAPHWFEGTEHEADPFVVALAIELGAPVVTYEGVRFDGSPAAVAVRKRSMPIVCAALSVDVATLADVLDDLGVRLR
jgi:hypothetical protein